MLASVARRSRPRLARPQLGPGLHDIEAAFLKREPCSADFEVAAGERCRPLREEWQAEVETPPLADG
jgi:hypothetical protein